MLTCSFSFRSIKSPSRISCYDGICWNVYGHDASRAHNGILSHNDAAQQGRARTNRCTAFDESSLAVPVRFRLEFTVRSRCAWIAIVDKCYVMSHKNAAFDRNTFADKGVA